MTFKSIYQSRKLFFNAGKVTRGNSAGKGFYKPIKRSPPNIQIFSKVQFEQLTKQLQYPHTEFIAVYECTKNRCTLCYDNGIPKGMQGKLVGYRYKTDSGEVRYKQLIEQLNRGQDAEQQFTKSRIYTGGHSNACKKAKAAGLTIFCGFWNNAERTRIACENLKVEDCQKLRDAGFAITDDENYTEDEVIGLCFISKSGLDALQIAKEAQKIIETE